MSNFFATNAEETAGDNFADSVEWELVTTNERLREVAAELSKESVLAIDTENAGLDPHLKWPLLLQIGTSDKCYIFEHYADLDFSPIREVLEDAGILKVFFNAKYDWKWIFVHYDIRVNNIFCCQVAERLLTVGLPGARIHVSLRDVVEKYLGIQLKKEARSGFIDRDPEAEPITEEMFAYSAADVVLLPEICSLQIDKLNKLGVQLAAQLEFDVLPPTAESEVLGVLIDQVQWRKLLVKAQHKFDSLSKDLYACFDSVVAQKTLFGFPTFKLSSNQQLLKNLNKLLKRNNLGFELLATDGDTLKKYKGHHEVFDLLLPWRGYQKVLSTYGEKLLALANPTSGRLHCQFNQVRAATGRMSSEKPNLQNIPGYDPEDPTSLDFRSCFIAKPGYKLVTADFSQQELRILADMSGDTTFYKAYTELDEDGKALDVHRYTASAVFEVPYKEVTDKQRKQAKCVHPGTILGVETDGQFVFKSIKDAVTFSSEHDSFADCPPGVNVLNQYGGLTAVKQTYNGGLKRLKVVTSRYGVVVCSENHRFLLKDGRLVRSADLKETDILAPKRPTSMYRRGYPTIRYKMHRDLPELSYTPTDDTAYFAGVFLGDGTASTDYAGICIGDITKPSDAGELEFKAWFDSLVVSLKKVGLNPKMSTSNELVNIGSRQTMKFLRALQLAKSAEDHEEGKNYWVPSEGKYSCRILRVPSWVLESGQTAVLSMLGGLIDTDGWVTKDGGQIALCTKDPVFAGQLVALANSCGIQTSSEPSYNTTYKRYYWKVHFSKSQNTILEKYIRHPTKKALIQYTNRKSPNKENKILKVSEYSEIPTKCLDLSIDSEDHIYSTNGLFTHNTLNFFLVYGGGAHSLGLTLKISKEEAEQIISDYFQRYDKIKYLLDSFGASALNKGFVQTISGRKRFLLMPTDLQPGSDDFKKARASIKRQAGNTPIQGCLVGSTRVLTQLGYQPISMLEELGADVGVWTGTHYAAAHAVYKGNWESAKVVLQDGSTIRCDTRHKFLVPGDNDYVWKDYEELQEGDFVCRSLARNKEFFPQDRTSLPKEYRSGWWYWLGRYVGDGNIFCKKRERGHRATLCYAFGSHEKKAVSACVSFWKDLGYNPRVDESTHTPCRKESTRYRVSINSKKLVEQLISMGFVQATAHTKRLPQVVFELPVSLRTEFIRGLFEADGWLPSGGTGDMPSLHLCQRPLLEDTKIILHSLGVESSINGPYSYSEFTSYRLDVCGTMLRELLGTKYNNDRPRLKCAPPGFVLDNFRSKYSGQVPDRATRSDRALLRRVYSGGSISVYTLKDLLNKFGWSVDYPLYVTKECVEKKSTGQTVKTYTMVMSDPAHRFDAEGVITHNSGADVTKLAMVFVHRRLLKEGFDARILMVVHDELVVEVREDQADVVAKIVEEEMVRAFNHYFKNIPMVVDAHIGPTWEK